MPALSSGVTPVGSPLPKSAAEHQGQLPVGQIEGPKLNGDKTQLRLWQIMTVLPRCGAGEMLLGPFVLLPQELDRLAHEH